MNRFQLTTSILIFLMLGACIEDFEFDGISTGDGIVVEGFISNQSYNDLIPLPLPSRYFTLKLSHVGAVKNVRNNPVLGARIELHQSNGTVYDYAEIGNGEYGLFYEDFRTEPGFDYHLQISLADGRTIISEIQSLERAVEVGELSIKEQKILDYINIEGEVSIEEQDGIGFYVTTLTNDAEEPVYYKWDMTITWIYNAALANENNPNKYCWATSKNYYQNFHLLEDADGNIEKELFFLKTSGSRLNHGFSVLIRQLVTSRDYYSFHKEVQKQLDQSELFATPPYNLASNFSSDDTEVFGYFGVVNEKFSRWYFDSNEISNYGGWVEDERCSFGPPYAPWCFDCQTLSYDDEPVSSSMPDWWDPLYFRRKP